MLLYVYAGAGFAPNVKVYVSGNMRFKDGRGVIPEGAGQADVDGWQLCLDGTHRRGCKKGTEISVPFNRTGHAPVHSAANSTTPQLQVRSSHKQIEVSWNKKLICQPRVTRNDLNEAYNTGKPAKVSARGKLPDRYIWVDAMEDE